MSTAKSCRPRPADTKSARTIFLDALDCATSDERDRLIESACAGDDLLRQEIRRLLKAHGDLNHFMERPAAGLAATIDRPASEQIGATIGRYRLLEQLGEGGMGVVYVAEQSDPVRRRVALKIIKPGMDTRQVIARFEAERQALAMMDHPNIAKVYDAGATENGRPYFVMELVRGMPITDYCDQAQLAVSGRLALLTTVCHAVQHAHQKGIIHRDIKPNNVLVTLHDGQPVVKVIDFGVAKAVNQQLTERTIYTAFAEIIGTPLYMSPEQAELSCLDVDTRSDVYSLGVLLYELLTGQTPFDRDTLVKAGLDEIRRMIREDDPPRPSHRISTLKGDAGSKVSQKRGIDHRQLIRALKGELDWIVMKALEKDRNRRYESAGGLAEDLQRYLSHLPIHARPPGFFLRARKWCRRHPVRAVSLMAITILLHVLLFGSYWHSRQLSVALTVSDELRNAGLARERALRRELLTNDLTTARQAAITGNLEEVHRLLDRDPPTEDAGGHEFVWHYLRALCPQPIRTLIGHESDLLTADISPDDRLIASGDRGGEIKIWDLPAGREIKSLRYGIEEVCSVRFSPDGRHLATAGQDGTIRLWDVATWAEVAKFSQHTQTVCGLAWSPDSKWLASGGRDFQVHVWDVEAETLHKTLELHDDVVRCVAWSPDGSWLASANGNRGMWLFKTSTWARERIVAPLEGESGILAAAFSHDGKYLAYGGYAREVRVFDLESQTDFAQSSSQSNVWSMCFTSQGELITGMTGGAVQLLDLWPEKRQLHSMRQGIGEAGSIRTALTTHSGEWLVTASEQNRTLKIWDFSRVRGHEIVTVPDTLIGVLAQHELLMSMDTSSQRLRLRSLLDGSIKATLPFAAGFEPPVPCFSQSHNLLAVVGADRRVCLWDVATWTPRQYLEPTEFPVRMLSFSADGDWLAAACDRGVVGAWNIGTGAWQQLLQYEWEHWPKVAFSPSESLLAVAADVDAGISLWRLDNAKRVAEFPAAREIQAIAISPDGTVLAAADLASAVSLWELPSGSPLGVLRGHSGRVGPMAFTPDGSTLASTSDDGTVRLSNVSSRRELFPIAQHERAASWIGFLSDRRLAVIRTPGHELLIFDATQKQ
jgi:eukaryotic-like serine/threonine-protein kinase